MVTINQKELRKIKLTNNEGTLREETALECTRRGGAMPGLWGTKGMADTRGVLVAIGTIQCLVLLHPFLNTER